MKRILLSSMLIVAIALAMVLSATAALAATPQDIQDAIDDGMVWLDGQQLPDGSWGTEYEVARTGLALVKFESHAYQIGMSPFDPAYMYSQTVVDGLNYIFSSADSSACGMYMLNPSGQQTYQTGIAMMAIAESGDMGRVVSVGNPVVDGMTYGAVLQALVDYFVCAQNPDGGWRYFLPPDPSDNSNSGSATLGLLYAETAGATIPQSLRNNLDGWIDYIQNDQGVADDGAENDPDGGSMYEGPDWMWVNILKTGNLLQEMCMVGDTAATLRVQYAVDYLVRHWNDPGADIYDEGWQNNYQATFTVMKGLTCLNIETIGGIDWYDEMSDMIVATQNADGSWPSDGWGDPQLTTCWAMLMLQKVAPPSPPTVGGLMYPRAEAGNGNANPLLWLGLGLASIVAIGGGVLGLRRINVL